MDGCGNDLMDWKYPIVSRETKLQISYRDLIANGVVISIVKKTFLMASVDHWQTKRGKYYVMFSKLEFQIHLRYSINQANKKERIK